MNLIGKKLGDTVIMQEDDFQWICRECKENMPQRRKEFDGYCEKCYRTIK